MQDVHNWSICCNFWADWIRSVCYDMQLKFWMEDLLSPSPFSWSWLTAAELGQRERGISLFWAARGFLRGGIPIFLTVGLSGDRAGSQWCNGKSEALGSKSDTTEQEEFTRRRRKRPICLNFSLIGEQLEHYSYSRPCFYIGRTQANYLEMCEMMPMFLEKLIFPLFDSCSRTDELTDWETEDQRTDR